MRFSAEAFGHFDITNSLARLAFSSDLAVKYTLAPALAMCLKV